MTEFKALLLQTGINKIQAAGYFDVNQIKVKLWIQGKAPVPDRIIGELYEILYKIQNSVNEALDMIDELDPPSIQIDYCETDEQAQERGFPFKSCHDMVVAEVAVFWGQEKKIVFQKVLVN